MGMPDPGITPLAENMIRCVSAKYFQRIAVFYEDYDDIQQHTEYSMTMTSDCSCISLYEK